MILAWGARGRRFESCQPRHSKMETKSEVELHVHPYFNKYGLEDLVKAMEENEINVAALEFLNGRILKASRFMRET